MKKLSVLLLVGVIMISGCGKNETDSATDKEVKESTDMTSDEIAGQAASVNVVKKYPIKSGITTFQRSGVVGDNEIIVYFDDYGIKERNEVYGEDGLISEVTMSDGVNMYKITKQSIEEKKAYIMGPGLHGTEMKFIIDPFNNNDKRKLKYEYKKLENINVIGKDCEAYSVKAGGGTTIFAGWEGILLYTKVVIPMGTMETIALDFSENADVDPNLFKIPADYQVEKM